MTEKRWLAEIALVEENLPQFTPFVTRNEQVGFAGTLKGSRTGRVYQILIKARAADYPAQEPRTYIEPKPEPHHWIRASGEPYLCYQREKQWNPARSTFANCILIAVRYIHAFD